MNSKYMFSFIAVFVLFLVAYLGVEAAGLGVLFGVVLPYVAVLVFIAGFVSRVMSWARSATNAGRITTPSHAKTMAKDAKTFPVQMALAVTGRAK